MKIKILDRSFEGFDFTDPADLLFLGLVNQAEKLFYKILDLNKNKISRDDRVILQAWVGTLVIFVRIFNILTLSIWELIDIYSFIYYQKMHRKVK